MTRLLPWLALIALLMQAAIPAGLMPDFAARGPGLHLTLCDGVMPSAAEHMPDMKMSADHAPAQPHGKMPPCPYAMAASLWFTVALLVFFFRPIPAQAAFPHFNRFTSRRLPFGNAGARGPPSLTTI